jgi:carbon-monoxide dehydrogenase small subunit
VTIPCRINHRDVTFEVNPTRTLADLLRYEIGETDVPVICRQGKCGACVVLLDKKLVASCIIPAFRVIGSEILTVDGFQETQEYGDIRRGFERVGFTPCTLCAGSKVLLAHSILQRTLDPTADAVRRQITGAWCSCTGVSRYVEAIGFAGRERRRRYNARSRL